MLSVAEAQAAALGALGADPVRTEEVPLPEALGRALAAEIRSPGDQPPFDKSKMDGFAYAAAERATAGTLLRVVGAVPAGAVFPRRLESGECARIMTGALLPAGTSFVHRFEYARAEADSVVFERAETEDNVVLRGSHRRAGDPLLEPRVLGPGDIGVLASAGFARVPVARRPLLALLSTGGELAAPGEALVPGAVYDSNGPLLAALAARAGCSVLDLGRRADDPDALAAALEEGLSRADLLVCSGGVSAGDYDYLPRAAAAVGAGTVFHKVAVKPGMPLFLARRGKVLLFGLPGNPLSAFNDFGLFVEPCISRLLGLAHAPRTAVLRLSAPLFRTDAAREEHFPVRVRGASCGPLDFAGSSDLSVLADADGFAVLAPGVAGLEAGEDVLVRLLR